MSCLTLTEKQRRDTEESLRSVPKRAAVTKSAVEVFAATWDRHWYITGTGAEARLMGAAYKEIIENAYAQIEEKGIELQNDEVLYDPTLYGQPGQVSGLTKVADYYLDEAETLGQYYETMHELLAHRLRLLNERYGERGLQLEVWTKSRVLNEKVRPIQREVEERYRLAELGAVGILPDLAGVAAEELGRILTPEGIVHLAITAALPQSMLLSFAIEVLSESGKELIAQERIRRSLAEAGLHDERIDQAFDWDDVWEEVIVSSLSLGVEYASNRQLEKLAQIDRMKDRPKIRKLLLEAGIDGGSALIGGASAGPARALTESMRGEVAPEEDRRPSP